MRASLRLNVFACAALIAGCAAVDESGDRRDAAAAVDAEPPEEVGTASDCEAVMEEVLITCGNIVCHDPFSGGIGLDLDLSNRSALPGSLLDLRSTPDCGSVPYLDPDAPSESLILQKLSSPPPSGERMPAGDRPPLDAAQLACFEAWVRTAAQR